MDTPSDWTTARLSDLCAAVEYGYTASATTDPCGPRFLRITDIRQGALSWKSVPFVEISEDKIEKYRLRHGDVVVARTGAFTGANAYISEPPDAVFASYLVRLRAAEDVASRFLYYFMQSKLYRDFVGGVIGGSAQPNASAKTLTKAEVPVPPLPEQRRIAAILGALDDKIELNRRMNRTLEEMAQAIFKSWFIDFDGHTDLVDSELGPIPRGWAVEPIGEAAKAVGGGTPSTKKAEYWEGGTHCWTTPKDLSALSTPVLLDTARRITDAGLAKISSGLLPVGTVLLSSRAPVGYLAVAQVPVAVNQGYIALLPSDRLSTMYLLHWCRSNLDRIKARAGGTTFQEISKRNFRPIPALIPPKEEMSRFDSAVEPMFERLVANEREAGTLAQLRDTLLPKLISGEIRVPEAEEAIEGS